MLSQKNRKATLSRSPDGPKHREVHSAGITLEKAWWAVKRDSNRVTQGGTVSPASWRRCAKTWGTCAGFRRRMAIYGADGAGKNTPAPLAFTYYFQEAFIFVPGHYHKRTASVFIFALRCAQRDPSPSRSIAPVAGWKSSGYDRYKEGYVSSFPKTILAALSETIDCRSDRLTLQTHRPVAGNVCCLAVSAASLHGLLLRPT